MFAVWVDRDVVRVSGPDAESFLQGQLSQDVAAVGEGGSAWSLLLQPQGKIDALLRVTRVGPDAFVLDTDGGWGERVVERLNRFKLRIKADVELLAWRCLAVRGDGASVEAVRQASAALAGSAVPGDLVVDAAWGGRPGADILGPDPVVPAGVPVEPADAYEADRIAAGMPRMGAELDERTIPAEAGVVESAVSFTKGCYTGQELVARIDSRGGNVPRRLRRIVVSAGHPAAGATLHDPSGKEVGVITSLVGTGDGAVGLGYVARSVDPPAELEARWSGAPAPAAVSVSAVD